METIDPIIYHRVLILEAERCEARLKAHIEAGGSGDERLNPDKIFADYYRDRAREYASENF